MSKKETRPIINNAINRILYSQNNNLNDLTLVCIGGIHGNEPAGVYGLQKVVENIIKNKIKLKGNFYALLGNISAFKKNVRFQDLDLNRLWTKQDIEALNISNNFKLKEHKEQYELYTEIKKIISIHSGPFVFIDLHTTSSPTTPFITISDSLNNRSLANKFNLPIVLGIEEYLDGPLLTYINEFGHISMGFEAGSHQDEKSTLYCEAFVWLVMGKLELVDKEKFPLKDFDSLLNVKNGFYEITYKYSIIDHGKFKMISGFNNFDKIIKGQRLAQNKFMDIKSPFNGLIFMPLYQNQGQDGFFIVNKISKLWLLLSSFLRGLKFHELLRILPGIHKNPENEYSLIADKRIALFLTTKVFHLFGYRKKIIKDNRIHFIKRDRKVSVFV
jgi:hypothetical protein